MPFETHFGSPVRLLLRWFCPSLRARALRSEHFGCRIWWRRGESNFFPLVKTNNLL